MCEMPEVCQAIVSIVVEYYSVWSKLLYQLAHTHRVNEKQLIKNNPVDPVLQQKPAFLCCLKM
jgi:hypothetical protein